MKKDKALVTKHNALKALTWNSKIVQKWIYSIKLDSRVHHTKEIRVLTRDLLSQIHNCTSRVSLFVNQITAADEIDSQRWFGFIFVDPNRGFFLFFLFYFFVCFLLSSFFVVFSFSHTCGKTVLVHLPGGSCADVFLVTQGLCQEDSQQWPRYRKKKQLSKRFQPAKARRLHATAYFVN